MISDLVASADRAFSEGRLEEASGLCHTILEAEPGNFPAQLLLGVTAVKQGRFEEAIPALEIAEAADPGTGKASLWLSRALRHMGRSDEALQAAARAASASPADPSAQYQLGVCLLEARHEEDALACFQRLAKVDPASATVHHGLGLALKSLGRNSAALKSLKRASVLAPDSVHFRLSLFQALIDEGDSRGAVACASDLLTLNPNAESHLRLARALMMNNDLEAATASLRDAQSLGLEDGMVTFAAGTVLQGIGRIEEAESQFRRAIELIPDLGLAYSGLAYIRKANDDDRPFVRKMELVTELEGISDSNLSHLHYALGKAKEDLGEYPEAIFHYDEANRLARDARFGPRRFDRTLYTQRVDESLKTYGQSRIAGSASDLPIFVIGMLRSGTTLVEQILSSHSAVGSAGEQGFWLHNRDALADGSAVETLAGKYVAMLREMWPDKQRVVDKMPDNYLIAPVIHAAFPNAKIIHVARNPAATCLSIYTTINRLDLDWSHDKEDIAFVYREYRRMMTAWHDLLPADAILEVRYEDLVSNQENVTRQMVAFCGLPWEDACLSPELNPRAVSTPSSWQVRQPIFTSSVDRWRKFEPWIGPFVDLA